MGKAEERNLQLAKRAIWALVGLFIAMLVWERVADSNVLAGSGVGVLILMFAGRNYAKYRKLKHQNGIMMIGDDKSDHMQ